ncbi:hypothetical protein AAFF_G00397080 [Aldrovandia affinis]|uniref:Reverse transcriptase domain-containing protein n=1 Tax=Aldrovandia affinis TaxID=143900 RepID=A0AAD7SCZ5_9TELE|nr:hypothetical protein AAFF_G00397080 [Aldrovandia affinis]
MQRDIFLLQEVHLTDEEDTVTFTQGWGGRRRLVEVVKDFSPVDAFRVLHPSDAGFTWRNSRGAASSLDYIFGKGGQVDQTCGVPGRSCSWNLILLRDMLDWVKERNLSLALVSIDQEKAFDRVQHGFLFAVLG